MFQSMAMLLGGIALTLISARWLVVGSSSIAKHFHISDLVIGLTIVALGTSTPELAINIFSALAGTTDLAISNVLGSNISNILLIVGVSAVFAPLKVSSTTTWKEIPFSLLAAIVLAIIANDTWLDKSAPGNFISRTDGMILLCFFIIFMVYTFEMARHNPDTGERVLAVSLKKSALLAIVGVAGLFIGGKILVDGAITFSRMMGISERVIGLTVVAIGTSLPELATSVTAARMGKTEMAVGNIIGSNIMNIFLILGITATIYPLPFNIGASNVDIGLVVLSSLMLFMTANVFSPGRISKREGITFSALYVFYLISLIFIN